MIEWSDTEALIQQSIREFVDNEVRPNVDGLEHGELPPYDVLRKFFTAFGMDAASGEAFDKSVAKQAERERVAAGESRDGNAAAAGSSSRPAVTESAAATESGESADGESSGGMFGASGPGQESLGLIAVTELCRVSPGLVAVLGVSLGLASGTINAGGTSEQRKRWARDLVTFDKVGAWAITEPESGSDAFGGMKSTARPHGDGYVLNGHKTFITNGPFADTLVVYAKLDDGTEDRRNRQVLTFVLDSGMDGLTQSKSFRKMGLHSSPTGELFFDNVYVGPDRLLGTASGSSDAGRESARSNFATERFGVAAMSLGVIEECLALCVDYVKNRTLWGQQIADFQLIQRKIASMEVARMNVRNLVFRTVEMLREGRTPELAEASAMKLYSSEAATEVAMDAVQVFGGNGYMSEYRVEQLARDAKALEIYAGSNEIQTVHIAKGLLDR